MKHWIVAIMFAATAIAVPLAGVLFWSTPLTAWTATALLVVVTAIAVGGTTLWILGIPPEVAHALID